MSQLENFNFIKNSELHNTNILFKKKIRVIILTHTPLSI